MSQYNLHEKGHSASAGLPATKKLSPASDETRRKEVAEDTFDFKPMPRLPQNNSKPLLTRGNSTNSVTIQNTMAEPAVPQLIHSLAEYFHQFLKHVDPEVVLRNQKLREEGTPNEYFDEFDETLHPLSFKVHDCIHDDRVDHHAVEQWVKDIYRLGELQPECVVLARAFFDRMRENVEAFVFCTHTWRRAVLACLILASKIWEDMAVWNADFLGMIPRSDGRDLAQLEQVILRALDFNVEFSAQEYASVYFELRALGRKEASSCAMAGDDETLSSSVQKNLAARVAEFQEGLNSPDRKK